MINQEEATDIILRTGCLYRDALSGCVPISLKIKAIVLIDYIE